MKGKLEKGMRLGKLFTLSVSVVSTSSLCSGRL